MSNNGELFGLVGPDGAGKTTLFRILTTLIFPSRDRQPCSASTSCATCGRFVRASATCLVEFSLYPDLSVAENLEFFASVFGTTVEKGLRADRADLQTDRAVQGPSRRRAVRRNEAEARAVVRARASPRDPVSRRADDRRRRRLAPRVLGSARASSRRLASPIVVSTPYMDEAMRCDRVALIQGGRMLDIDPAGRRSATRYPLPLVAVAGRDRYRSCCALRELRTRTRCIRSAKTLHYTDDRADARHRRRSRPSSATI